MRWLFLVIAVALTGTPGSLAQPRPPPGHPPPGGGPPPPRRLSSTRSSTPRAASSDRGLRTGTSSRSPRTRRTTSRTSTPRQPRELGAARSLNYQPDLGDFEEAPGPDQQAEAQSSLAVFYGKLVSLREATAEALEQDGGLAAGPLDRLMDLVDPIGRDDDGQEMAEDFLVEDAITEGLALAKLQGSWLLGVRKAALAGADLGAYPVPDPDKVEAWLGAVAHHEAGPEVTETRLEGMRFLEETGFTASTLGTSLLKDFPAVVAWWQAVEATAEGEALPEVTEAATQEVMAAAQTFHSAVDWARAADRVPRTLGDAARAGAGSAPTGPFPALPSLLDEAPPPPEPPSAPPPTTATPSTDEDLSDDPFAVAPATPTDPVDQAPSGPTGSSPWPWGVGLVLLVGAAGLKVRRQAPAAPAAASGGPAGMPAPPAALPAADREADTRTRAPSSPRPPNPEDLRTLDPGGAGPSDHTFDRAPDATRTLAPAASAGDPPSGETATLLSAAPAPPRPSAPPGSESRLDGLPGWLRGSLEGVLPARYTQVQLITSGGMGSVLRAWDEDLSRAVAIKVPAPHLASVPEVRIRFLREARALASLSHPSITQVYDVHDLHPDEPPLMVMELLEGQDLARYVEDKGAASVADALRWTREAGEALAHAHENGILHRDVKPANLFRTQAGAVKLVDFGLVTAEDFSALTATGARMGSLPYMPPEQLRGARVDARADLFSLAASLHQFLTGDLPYRPEDRSHEVPPDAAAVRRDLPPGLPETLKKAMAADPDERFASVREFLAALG